MSVRVATGEQLVIARWSLNQMTLPCMKAHHCCSAALSIAGHPSCHPCAARGQQSAKEVLNKASVHISDWAYRSYVIIVVSGRTDLA